MKNVIIFMLMCLTGYFAKAQSLEKYLVSSAGGYFETTNSNLEYSIGEIAVGELNTSTIHLGQGFNQAVVESVGSIEAVSNAHLKVFSNPGVETIGFFSDENLTLSIYDMTGKEVLKSLKLTKGERREIPIQMFTSGVYIIQLTEQTGSVSTIRFVKR